jgi:hypothetical protein
MSRDSDLGYDPDKGYIYARVVLRNKLFGQSVEQISVAEGLTERTTQRYLEDGIRWLVHKGSETAVWKRVRAAMAESAT